MVIAQFVNNIKIVNTCWGSNVYPEDMDIKDLRYFIAVYEANSFMRASIALATVQSNVSMRIRRLEDDLRATLFVRGRRGVRPTKEGELLYRYAKDVLKKMNEAREEITKLDAA
jgi:DNA-binding transcriptional LysR family regulator